MSRLFQGESRNGYFVVKFNSKKYIHMQKYLLVSEQCAFDCNAFFHHISKNTSPITSFVNNSTFSIKCGRTVHTGCHREPNIWIDYWKMHFPVAGVYCKRSSHRNYGDDVIDISHFLCW